MAKWWLKMLPSLVNALLVNALQRIVREWGNVFVFCGNFVKVQSKKHPACFSKNVTGCWANSRLFLKKAGGSLEETKPEFLSGYSPMDFSHSPINKIHWWMDSERWPLNYKQQFNSASFPHFTRKISFMICFYSSFNKKGVYFAILIS